MRHRRKVRRKDFLLETLYAELNCRWRISTSRDNRLLWKALWRTLVRLFSWNEFQYISMSSRWAKNILIGGKFLIGCSAGGAYFASYHETQKWKPRIEILYTYITQNGRCRLENGGADSNFGRHAFSYRLFRYHHHTSHHTMKMIFMNEMWTDVTYSYMHLHWNLTVTKFEWQSEDV